MSRIRRVLLFGLAVVAIATAFVVGFGAVKYDVFRHSPRELITRVALRLIGPEPFESPYRSALNMTGCQCLESWGVCPCGSTTTLPAYEQEILRQVSALPMPEAPPLAPNFRERLGAAVGYDNIRPAPGEARIETVSREAFEGGEVEHLAIDYDLPRVRLRARHAKHEKTPDKLLIVLHGVAANAERVMDGLGRRYFKAGFDVLAFDITSNTSLMALVNAAWQLQGVHAAGLWPRLVCDVARIRAVRKTYRRVVVYGQGDGAKYAGYLANLCAPFSLVVMEGGDRDPQQDYALPLRRVYRFYLGYWHDHLTPFPAGTSIRDLVANAESPVVFLGDGRDYRTRMRTLMAPAFEWRDGIAPEGRAWLAFKGESRLDNILNGSWQGVAGATLERRRR